MRRECKQKGADDDDDQVRCVEFARDAGFLGLDVLVKWGSIGAFGAV